MTFLELAKRRCSIRSYSDRPIDKETWDYVLEAGRMAPSACNNQPWFFMVVRDEKLRDQLRELYDRPWVASVPAFIVVLADHDTSWKRRYDAKDHADIDVAIATEHLCLAAAEKGLGTCWICSFDRKKCADLLRLPEPIEPVVILPIGYPTDEKLFETTPKNRKSLADIVRYDSFGD